MDLLDSYESLSPSPIRNDVAAAVLRSIINAPPFAFAPTERDRLVQLLLRDIGDSIQRSDGKGRLPQQDIGLALLALKILGRAPAASTIISKENNLKVLLGAAETLRDVDNEAADDALRCVANALLLIEKGRATWVNLRGSTHCVNLLEKTTSPTCIFLCSRILFLSTASAASELLKGLLDHPADSTSGGTHDSNAQQDIINIISNQLDFLLSSILQNTLMSKEAMTDLLKLTFNLLCHWPKIAPDAEDSSQDSGNDVERATPELADEDRPVLGERWTKRLDGILPSLRRVFIGLPPVSPAPLAAPLAHVLHALLPIPVSDRLYSVWFPEQDVLVSNESSNIGSSNIAAIPPDTHSQVSCGSVSSTGTTLIKGKEKDGEFRGAFDRALSMLTPRLSLSSRSPSPSPQVSKEAELPPTTPEVLRRSVELLDMSLAHYLPGNVDPDDASVRRICVQEDVQLDHVLTPLVLLLTKFCKSNVSCRKCFREHILPSNLDRSSSIEGRANALGRCVRLMACVNHPQLKDAVGELLFIACDSDAQALSGQIGYGNAAGFLFNKGILSAPPSGSSSGASAVTDPSVNPITGMIQREQPSEPEMTDEEKEREAEKLFVLFERLEKSGGMENPIKKALHEGKLEKYTGRPNKDEDSD
ncbi:guanine nucleotide exchange factor [Phellopilus nigrolimitatus]|nr:guanine nucleotide exchange factor [Phellopilus nigrolimitatus]